jgi:AraC-like DNA-binding protein/mannose-6-phosphate isomerase-like protein (cupin superfamily)
MGDLPKSGYTVSQNEYFPEINLPLRLTRPAQSSARFHPLHFHDFTEIGIIISGEAKHLIRRNPHMLKQGDVILVPRGTSHGYAYMKEFGILNLLFIQPRLPLPLLDFGSGQLARKIFSSPNGKAAGEKLMTLTPEQLNELTAVADRILAEEKSPGQSFYFLLMALFMEILVILDRAYSPDEKFHSLSSIPSVLEFFEKNYQRNIDFDTLARKFGMSRRSFFRHFRAAAGTTPQAYLNSIRIRKAAELLRETDMPLSSIALECGFSDSFLMARSFKKAIGSTPVAFRKSHSLHKK